MSETEDMPELVVLATADAVAEAAARSVASALAEAIAQRGVAHWATTGGSSAPGIYRQLGRSPLRETVDWSRVHVWWSDDRYVPADHPLSNALPLVQILLASGGDEATSGTNSADVGGHGDGVEIPAGQIHEIPMTEAIARAGGVAWAAAVYSEWIRDAGPAAGPGGLPVFDVLLLGVGPDGHVMSVFPGSAAWDAEGLAVGVPAPTHIEPHVDRVTLHPRLLAAARRVVVLTTGESKADALGRAWAGADVRELPVGAAKLATATWILDEAAAARLPRS